MKATSTIIDEEVFRFSGQSLIDTWSLRDQLVSGCARYSKWLVADMHLTMQRIVNGNPKLTRFGILILTSLIFLIIPFLNVRRGHSSPPS